MVTQWTFRLDWIVPYVRTTQMRKHFDKAYHRYAKWKDFCRSVANTKGVPSDLASSKRYEVHVAVYWKGKARADLDNCCKGILDSLWKQDRRVLKITAEALEHQTRGDWVLVTVLET